MKKELQRRLERLEDRPGPFLATISKFHEAVDAGDLETAQGIIDRETEPAAKWLQDYLDSVKENRP